MCFVRDKVSVGIHLLAVIVENLAIAALLSGHEQYYLMLARELSQMFHAMSYLSTYRIERLEIRV